MKEKSLQGSTPHEIATVRCKTLVIHFHCEFFPLGDAIVLAFSLILSIFTSIFLLTVIYIHCSEIASQFKDELLGLS